MNREPAYIDDKMGDLLFWMCKVGSRIKQLEDEDTAESKRTLEKIEDRIRDMYEE